MKTDYDYIHWNGSERLLVMHNSILLHQRIAAVSQFIKKFTTLVRVNT